MKKEIKDRIEAVRRGEVPEGYISENHQLHPTNWHHEKLGKYLKPYDEFSNDTEAYPLATSSRQGLMLQSEYYNDQRYEETTGGFHVVPEGYVTYRHMSDDDIFRFNVNRMGTPVLVSPEYPVFTTSDGLCQDLLIAYLNNMKEFTAYCSAQKKGSTRTRMYFSRLGEFVMPIPPASEQKKIAEILATCDRVIELKQSKIDELNKLKQTYLRKMFPQKGQTVPEVRFPGFSDPWEQRKLSELAEKTYGGGTPSTLNEAFWDGDIPWIQSSDVIDGRLFGVVPRKRITQYGLNNSATQLVPKNSIAIITRVGVGKLAFMPYSYATSQDFLSLSKLNAEPLFTVYACYKKLQSELNAVQGTSIKGITKDELLAKTVMVPQYAEQQQIGAFFSQLDNLITLHQRELEEYGKYKKALMQLLLTGLVRVNA